MQPVIEVRELRKRYGAAVAVDDVSFAVQSGRCFGLLGPNGAGKTTVVEIIEGIREPSGGEVLYRGRPLDRDFREVVGIQFQATALQEKLTVREHLTLFARLYRQRAPLDELVDLCDLGEYLDRDPGYLSGGQRQRLLLALALVNDPDVVFLDEPTTGLDPQARRRFWSLVEAVRARGKTIVLTTHYMEEAYQLCDSIVIMDCGRIIARGAPRDLLADHFGETILELPRAAVDQAVGPLRWRLLPKGERVELPTRNVDAAIRDLLAVRVPLDDLRVREHTLEDLFLELTGKALRQ